MRNLVLYISLALTGLGCSGTAVATASYPDQPIRLIVGWPPGGATDSNARLLANAPGDRLGQSVIVENRPGAGGAVGGGAAARSVADGYTLSYIASSNVITSLLIDYPSYGAGRDLEPVSLISTEPLLLLVPESSPAEEFDEFLTYAKKAEDGLNYATTGVGGILHLAGAALLNEMGLTAVDVPYKGTAPALAALMAGDVQFFFGTFSDAVPLVESGRVRALAITSEERSTVLADVPTLSEVLGRPNTERGTWQAVLAPKGTPEEIVRTLAEEIGIVMREPSIRQQFSSRGVMPIGSSPAVLADRISDELGRRGEIIKKLDIKAN